MDGISFPDPARDPTPSMIRTTDGQWKPLGGVPNTAAVTIEEVIRSTYENIWVEVLQTARAGGQPFAEIELGDPGTESGREFYMGCKAYLSKHGFEFEEARIPASGTTASRLIARIKL